MTQLTYLAEAPLRIAPSAPHPGTNPALRAGLVALADYLTGLDDYPDPWDLFAAFVPWMTDRQRVENWAAELLRCVVARVSDFELEITLDYLTGVR
ncbi:hypothetical protein OG417_03330 [Actinoallomurus sp. NBC_01490]|uniref:hypothetical protein n=1 Tax=Actinoallomurus sp. NBC_01490 TaxID=2903557 RepID=UPI002E35E6A4|nr:hypothetical protein [Actinoallomurus sp. NBC_01490]